MFYRAPEVFRIDPRSIVVPGLAGKSIGTAQSRPDSSFHDRCSCTHTRIWIHDPASSGRHHIRTGWVFVRFSKYMIFYLSKSEVVERIKAYILAHPEILDDKAKWIEGMGWDQTKWDGAQFPTSVRELDANPMRPCAHLTF